MEIPRLKSSEIVVIRYWKSGEVVIYDAPLGCGGIPYFVAQYPCLQRLKAVMDLEHGLNANRLSEHYVFKREDILTILRGGNDSAN